MKHVLITALALFASVPAFAGPEIELRKSETQDVIKVLTSQRDSTFSGGMHQGISSYAAQIECGFTSPDDKRPLSKAPCYIRSTAGFAANPRVAPLKLDESVASFLRKLLEEDNMSYLISNGWQVLGGRLYCEKNEGGDESIKDSCVLRGL